MLAFIFVLLSWFTGYYLLKKTFPWIYRINNQTTLTGEKINEMTPKVITLPASFLIGNFISTWITYISSYLFHYFFKVPMVFGNIVTFIYLIVLSLYFILKEKAGVAVIRNIKNYNRTDVKYIISKYRFEFNVTTILLIFYGIFFFAYLSISNGKFIFGNAVSSDLQFHVALSRSFSFGSNFPTQYPYFPNGRINYHFLFQFLAGNLEFLGLRIDYAYNILSTLSMTAFLLLLYSFSIMITGKKWVGVLVNIFFILRSSCAFFTFSAGSKTLTDLLNQIIHIDKFIGKTQCEWWGLWTQNVYMGQRHFAFSLGIMVFIFILIFPLFRKMIKALRQVKSTEFDEEDKKVIFKKRLKLWLREFLFKEDAWIPVNTRHSYIIGLILGLTGFWNGAVFMTLLPMLCIIAIMSKHRLYFFNIALISTIIFFLQYFFFLGLSNQGLSPKINIGFLADKPTLISILWYYIQLLGIMPFLLLLGIFIGPKGSKWLSLAFLVPLVMATTMQFTGSVPGFNHKLVNISIALLNIFPAYVIYRFFANRKTLVKFVAVIMAFLMTVTGIVDMFTVYNKSNFVTSYYEPQTDPLTEWIIKDTDRNAIFLTHTYDNIHPVVKAGRKMFFASVLFANIAGYNTDERENIYKKLIRVYDEKETRDLIKKYNISYIIIDKALREAEGFNETFYTNNYPLAYSDNDNKVYKLF